MSSTVCAGSSAGCLELGGEPGEVVHGAVQGVRGRAGQVGGVHAQGSEHGLGEVLGERHPGGAFEVGGGLLDPPVRVDPSGTRRRDDPGVALEPVAGGVGEQVPEGRAGRAGGVVELDRALLDADHQGVTGDDLADARDTEPSLRVAVGCARAGRGDHRRGDVRNPPGVDGREGIVERIRHGEQPATYPHGRRRRVARRPARRGLG